MRGKIPETRRGQSKGNWVDWMWGWRENGVWVQAASKVFGAGGERDGHVVHCKGLPWTESNLSGPFSLNQMGMRETGMRKEGAQAWACHHTKSHGGSLRSVPQGLLGDRAGHFSELTLVWDKGATRFLPLQSSNYWLRAQIESAHTSNLLWTVPQPGDTELSSGHTQTRERDLRDVGGMRMASEQAHQLGL